MSHSYWDVFRFVCNQNQHQLQVLKWGYITLVTKNMQMSAPTSQLYKTCNNIKTNKNKVHATRTNKAARMPYLQHFCRFSETAPKFVHFRLLSMPRKLLKVSQSGNILSYQGQSRTSRFLLRFQCIFGGLSKFLFILQWNKGISLALN